MSTLTPEARYCLEAASFAAWLSRRYDPCLAVAWEHAEAGDLYMAAAMCQHASDHAATEFDWPASLAAGCAVTALRAHAWPDSRAVALEQAHLAALECVRECRVRSEAAGGYALATCYARRCELLP